LATEVDGSRRLPGVHPSEYPTLLEEAPNKLIEAVLVEGNREPSSRISRAASGFPLGETPFVACLNAHLRESLAP